MLNLANKIAVVFPGQGSQAVGMLQDIATQYPLIQQVFAEASAVLNYDLWALVQTGSIEQLNQTEFTQPAVLTAGVALWRLLSELTELRPIILAGHSLGEYTALVCADALSLAAAVRLVAMRGKLMQNAVPDGQGAMAAILGLTADQVTAMCAEAAQGEVVQAVNFNAPGQIVIAGNQAAVARAMQACKQAGAKRALLLPLSVPSHCSLMQQAAEQFKVELAKVAWQKLTYLILHNFDVATHQQPAELVAVLAQQLYNPVRWIETVEKIQQRGAKLIIECGPGKVLTGLNKRIISDSSIEMLSIGDLAGLRAVLETL